MPKALILAASLAASLAAIDAAADTVRLAYGWYPGIRSTVEFKGAREQQGPRGTRRSSASGRYVLTTSEHEQGLRIDFTDVELDVEAGDGAGADPRVTAFVNRLTSTIPSYVVSAEGTLLEVAGLDELQSAMRAEFDALLADVPEELRERLAGMMDVMLSKEQLLSQSRQSWNRDVGQWIGAELDSGYSYQAEESAPSPAFGGAAVPMRVEYEYRGRVACNDADEAPRCARLVMRSTVDPDGLRPALERFFARIGQPLPENVEFRSDFEVELVSEPDTLLPHRVRSRKLVATPDRSGRIAVQQVETKEMTYRYESR